MKVVIISKTASLVEGISDQDLIAHIARVSNPDNQMNTETGSKLLAYLIGERHWSPFEQVSMGVSIETSRGIAPQILRHWTFSFQEFSQRYAKVDQAKLEYPQMRMAAEINRQSSTEPASDDIQLISMAAITDAFDAYDELVSAGVATESARFVLPLATPTKLYMNGTIRSWIHYLEQRCDPHTQKEHRDLAYLIRDILLEHYPDVHAAITFK